MDEERNTIKEMQKVLDDFYAAPIYAEVQELQLEFSAMERAKGFQSIESTAQKALQLQVQIHEDYSKSRFVDHSKRTTLEMDVERLEALPLFAQSEENEILGRRFTV